MIEHLDFRWIAAGSLPLLLLSVLLASGVLQPEPNAVTTAAFVSLEDVQEQLEQVPPAGEERADIASLRDSLFAPVDSLLQSSIRDGAFPGAAVAIGRPDYMYTTGAGTYTYDSEQHVTSSSLFDLASLTKPVATTTAIMQLYEQGAVRLNDRVADYLPAFDDGSRSSITISNLLTHTSGLPAHRNFFVENISDPAEILSRIMHQEIDTEPGIRTTYSDLGFITLALIVESVTEQSFADYAHHEIFLPLGMYSTGFRSVGAGPNSMIVPTEHDGIFRNKLMQGEVHDETAYLLGGAAGHAGLFSTADDLALFGEMMINRGTLHGAQFLKPETIATFTERINPGGSTRALGWDTRSASGYSSAGQYLGMNSYGHTGFTGTSFWVDPDQELYVILLTNRVHPTRDNRLISRVRPAVADLAFQAAVEADMLLADEKN